MRKLTQDYSGERKGGGKEKVVTGDFFRKKRVRCGSGGRARS